jgi:arylsulfatase
MVRASGGQWELYNLSEDRTEQNNLAAKQPRRVEQMKATYEAWMERANVLEWGELQKARRK